MKRIVSVTMVLLLCFAMAVPALAAEQYEFYHAPAVLPELDRLDGGVSFVSESVISPGRYCLTLVAGDTSLTSLPFTLSFSPFEFEGLSGDICYFNVSFSSALDESEIIVCPAAVIVSPGFGTGLSFVGADGEEVDLFPRVDYVILTPVSSDLFDVISDDMLQDALDQLVSLLPVVLAVIVGCVGLRKAIAWLLNVMRSS